MKSCVFSGGLRAGAAMGVAACLVAGTGGAAGAVSDAVSADPVEGYVERVYQDLLARTVDDSGRATWSIAIRSGAPRVRVANGIAGSDEFRSGLIHGAYQDYLGRDADPSGLTSWLAAMRGGATIQQLEAGFLASPEYVADAGADWVRAMYSDVLGRDASPREVEIWEDVLRRGAATRHGIALGILLSDEHLGTVIDTDYQELLGRGIDPTGRRGWVSAIQAGTRYEQVLGGILASNEYWTLGIPDESVPLRNDGRVGDFPANAPESDVITFLNTHLGETPVEVDDEGSCPTGRLWEYDAGLLLVVRTTDAAGQTVSPYVAGWILYGPPSTGTNRLHTAEGLRIGDPENRIPEVYPDAFEAHPDPDVRFWVSGPGDLGYGMQAVDAGQGFVVELIEGGEACDE